MDFILKYLNQPSTWRGLIGILTALGIAIKPDMANAVIAIGLATTGLVNVIRNEKKEG